MALARESGQYRLVAEFSLLAALFLGVAAAVVLRPPLGLTFLLAGSLLVPLEVATGTGTNLNFPSLFLPFLVLLWVVRLPRRFSPGEFLRPPLPALGLFLIVAALSLSLANSPRWAFAFAVSREEWFALARTAPLRAQIGQLGIFALSAWTFVLVADQIRSLRWLQVQTAVFLIAGGFCAASWVVPELRRPTQGLFPDGVVNGSLFWTWLMALAFTQAAFNRGLPPGVRFALAALCATALHVGIGPSRDWVSGWIPPLVAIAAALWLGVPRLALPVTLAGILLVAAKAERFVALVMSPDNQYSLKTRLEAWRILGRMTLANPVLGLGPANYYHDTHLFPILGWNVPFNSHNNYVDIVAQTGLLGLACLLWFFWQLGRIGWNLVGRAADGFARAYVLGALAGLAGTLAAGMLGDWFLPFLYNMGLRGFRGSMLGWFFLGGLVAVDRITRTAGTSHPPGSTATAGLRTGR